MFCDIYYNLIILLFVVVIFFLIIMITMMMIIITLIIFITVTTLPLSSLLFWAYLCYRLSILLSLFLLLGGIRGVEWGWHVWCSLGSIQPSQFCFAAVFHVNSSELPININHICVSERLHILLQILGYYFTWGLISFVAWSNTDDWICAFMHCPLPANMFTYADVTLIY